jgi:hypothetical protein
LAKPGFNLAVDCNVQKGKGVGAAKAFQRKLPAFVHGVFV